MNIDGKNIVVVFCFAALLTAHVAGEQAHEKIDSETESETKNREVATPSAHPKITIIDETKIDFLDNETKARIIKNAIIEEAVPMIAEFEKFRSDAYQDESGTWTVGFGSIYWVDENGKVQKVYPGMHVSRSEAEAMCLTELEPMVDNVIKHTSVTDLTIPEKASLCSFVYNVGRQGNGLLADIEAGISRQEIVDRMQSYCKVVRGDGVMQKSDGLVARREIETASFYDFNFENNGGTQMFAPTRTKDMDAPVFSVRIQPVTLALGSR